MKARKVFESFDPSFERDLNLTADKLSRDRNWGPVWDLAEKYPNDFKMKEVEGLHDRVMVPLSNNNVIKKRITQTEKITMLLNMIRENNIDYGGNFVKWMEDGFLTVYRGTANDPKGEGDYKSFTIDRNYAKKFFQDDWAMGGWVDRDVKGGWITTCIMSIKDNFHIYNNEMHENEVIVKGPAKCKTEYVENGSK